MEARAHGHTRARRPGICFRTEDEDDREIAAALRRHLTRLHAFVRTELESLQGDGVVRDDIDATSLAWMLVNFAIGFGMVAPIRSAGQARARGEMRDMLLTLMGS